MPPVVIYLDQNKWIDLARCVKDPDKYAENYAVLEILVRQVQKHAAIVPLSFTNIYETHKINNLGRRQHLAWVQSALSRGIVLGEGMEYFAHKSLIIYAPATVCRLLIARKIGFFQTFILNLPPIITLKYLDFLYQIGC